MNIAIDESPLKTGHFLQHRVRGTGFYIENLKKSLLRYYPKNKYTFFTRGENLPKDIDLVHYPHFEPFFLTLPLCKSYPTVVTVHDLTPLVFPKHFPAGIRGKIKWQIQRWSLRSAAAVITDSQSSKNDIVQYTGISDIKVHVVYLAAGEEFKKLEVRSKKLEVISKYNLPAKFVLYVGDATWNKNLPNLIRAIQKINLTLVMAGKATAKQDFDRTNPWNYDLAAIEGLAKNDKRIIRLGFIPQEDLVMLYNAATVFAMPSIYEGFGLPVLEAMACGTPVVAAKGGSLAEVVGDAGLFVNPYDIDSITNGINEVFFTKKLQEKFSKKGLSQAGKFFWEKTAEQTTKVYEAVCR